jgi:hypothetical protein
MVLDLETYRAIFRAGSDARLSAEFTKHKIPYDPFEEPAQYRAWLEGYQAAHAKLAEEGL